MSTANRQSLPTLQFNFVKAERTHKREKLAKTELECSEVISNFLYVGGEAVAKNFDYFTNNAITHVINCAGNTIANHHADKDITYMTLQMCDDGLETSVLTSIDINHLQIWQRARFTCGLNLVLAHGVRLYRACARVSAFCAQ